MSPAVTGSNGFQLLHFRIFHLPRRWGKRRLQRRWAPIQCTSDPTWPRPRTQVRTVPGAELSVIKTLKTSEQISSTSTHHKSHIVIYSHIVTLTRDVALLWSHWLLRMTLTRYLGCQTLRLSGTTSPSTATSAVEQRKNGVLPCGGIFLILSWCRHGRIWQDSTEIPPQLEENASYQSHLPHLPLRTRNYWHRW